MQQIYNDIQRRLEDKKFQEEMKEYEKQQIREKQEKMNLEDLEVQRMHRHRGTCNHMCSTLVFKSASSLTGYLLPGLGEEKGRATATAGGDHAHQCGGHTGQRAEERGGKAG